MIAIFLRRTDAGSSTSDESGNDDEDDDEDGGNESDSGFVGIVAGDADIGDESSTLVDGAGDWGSSDLDDERSCEGLSILDETSAFTAEDEIGCFLRGCALPFVIYVNSFIYSLKRSETDKQ